MTIPKSALAHSLIKDSARQFGGTVTAFIYRPSALPDYLYQGAMRLMQLLRHNEVVASHLHLLTASSPIRAGRLGMFCLSPDHTKQEENNIIPGYFTLKLDNGQELPIQINSISKGHAVTAYFQTASPSATEDDS